MRVWDIGVRILIAVTRSGNAWVVAGFVHVVPWGRIKDVGVAMWFRLRKDGEKFVGCFEGCWREIEAVE